jgi:allophanate hydrolase
MTAVDRVLQTFSLIRERGDDGVWIELAEQRTAVARAEEVEGSGLPLAGLLFAVKDNIDVAGLPTTAACPAYSYRPKGNAFVVQRLLDAGAIVIGKTNLDQFATGLNGTRTPHTIPRNAINPDFVSGGSSSGSAIAVALGEVDFALGTDTAGSGRVPAAFNNLVGFKPTRGRWSNSGLVPACRSLDCITVMAKSLAGTLAVDAVAGVFDEGDPWSRRAPAGFHPRTGRLAVLAADQREFFGDEDCARLYGEALRRAESLGWTLEEFDYGPFLEAAALLYNGPWVAERRSAIGAFLEAHPRDVHPVVRGIVEGGGRFSAVETFEAQYRLAEIVRATAPLWERCDSMLLPTAGTIYTVAQMLADPVALNSNLGRYTNFVNLMDLCAIAVPAGFRADGLPFGVSFIGPAWTEATQARLAGEFLGEPAEVVPPGQIRVAVVGAHLRGEPLNGQLLELGATFVAQTRTAPCYRLFALPETRPPKPGLVRSEGGGSIEVEIWSLSEAAFGRFVAAIPAPLGIGTVALQDGSSVSGFLCEGSAVRNAYDITFFGGWRAYRRSVG